MIAVRIGRWEGMSDKDLAILLSKKDVAELKNSKISGELFSDFPYERLNKKISMKVDDKAKTTAWGATCSKNDSNFFMEVIIKSELYNSLKHNGSYLGARYDTLGNKINLVNYEVERKYFRGLIDDLKYFKIIEYSV